METKKCSVCLKELPFSDFNKQKDKKFGLACACRNCTLLRIGGTKRTPVDIIDGECWKPIKEYQGMYEVSNKGRIKSTHHFVHTILELQLSSWEYHIISLAKNKTKKTFIVHRLVAEAFISNPDNNPQINHINGIKTDNYIENLEWCTGTENIQHAYRTGLNIPMKGEDSAVATLTNEQALSIFNDIDNQIAIGKKYSISRNMVNAIKTGRAWSSVTGKKYEFAENKKLTVEQAILIKNSNKKTIDLAREFGVCRQTVCHIKNGQRYAKETQLS